MVIAVRVAFGASKMEIVLHAFWSCENVVWDLAQRVHTISTRAHKHTHVFNQVENVQGFSFFLSCVVFACRFSFLPSRFDCSPLNSYDKKNINEKHFFFRCALPENVGHRRKLSKHTEKETRTEIHCSQSGIISARTRRDAHTKTSHFAK